MVWDGTVRGASTRVVQRPSRCVVDGESRDGELQQRGRDGRPRGHEAQGIGQCAQCRWKPVAREGRQEAEGAGNAAKEDAGATEREEARAGAALARQGSDSSGVEGNVEIVERGSSHRRQEGAAQQGRDGRQGGEGIGLELRQRSSQGWLPEREQESLEESRCWGWVWASSLTEFERGWVCGSAAE